jgi:hypothetical protein
MKAAILSVCLMAVAWGDPTTPDVGRPISELPAAVTAERGRVSLVADYSKRAADGSINVYLINRTDRDIQLAAQDGDVYLKLETFSDAGWIRAQPHVFSWCGNSYDFSPQVKAGCFLRIQGYQPPAGTRSKIRFRLYRQELEIWSNEGEGLVFAGDLKESAVDAMTVKTAGFEIVSKIALGELKSGNSGGKVGDSQWSAIHELGSGRFPREKAVEVLEKIKKNLPDYRQAASLQITVLTGRVDDESTK